MCQKYDFRPTGSIHLVEDLSMGPQERAIHLAQYLWIEPPQTTVVCESPLCKNFATFVSSESEYLCVYERKALEELTKK